MKYSLNSQINKILIMTPLKIITKLQTSVLSKMLMYRQIKIFKNNLNLSQSLHLTLKNLKNTNHSSYAKLILNLVLV